MINNMEEINFDKVAPFYKYRTEYSDNFVTELSRYLKLNKNMTILDLACGTGQLTQLISRHVGKVIAIDKSSKMLTHAAQAKNIEYKQHDLSIKPFSTNSPVDSIFISRAIPYLPTDILKNTFETSLKPNGKIVVFSCYLDRNTKWVETIRAIRKSYIAHESNLNFSGIEKMKKLNYKRKKCLNTPQIYISNRIY